MALSVLSKQHGVLWRISHSPVAYPSAVAFMEQHVCLMRAGVALPMVWLLCHPPLYSKGMSARPQDAPTDTSLPMYSSGRGGGYTYHGMGQRTIYTMLPMACDGAINVHGFVARLHMWLALSLEALGIVAVRRTQTSGLWVWHGGAYKKIASMGIRARHGISFHGISVNVRGDLLPFQGMNPCGFDGRDVIDSASLNPRVTQEKLDATLIRMFARVF
ncbi:MAG: lipoyl(octanoyl) transferase LipB [Alphaproteobacteria bacterium GM202ARS2]|nr:lipoyl(octanoyl) transferase LipB [Alphaproteobacteria bacterium GM202ARS2]